ncbi:hypothetical protein Tco_1562969 [Tanacetum coccineum]
MDNPNITMKEYIRLEEEKARRRGKVYNWETATYGKIWYDDDIHDLRSVETEFPAIVTNDELTSEKALSYEPTPTVSYFDDLDFLKDFENEFPAIVYNDALTYKSDSSTEPVEIHHRIDEFDLKNETSLSKYDEEEQNVLYFNDLFPFNIIYPDKDDDDNEIDIIQSSRGMALPPRDQRHQYLRFEGLQYTDANIADFEIRLGKIYKTEDADGAQGCSGTRFGEVVVDLDTAEALQFQLGGAECGRRDLSAYWREISSKGDFLGTPPSYTLIMDPMLRLCHRLIACSIAGRSQAREKVTVIDLLYLRGMDVGSVNVPYLWLAEHFGLLTEERLQGLTVIMRDLPVIDMAELVRLQICEELDDTWAWVALGPERQPNVAAGALEATKDAPTLDEGAPADPTPMQAPQPPHAAPKTMPQRIARLEEEVHELRWSIVGLRGDVERLITDQSRFATCMFSCMTQLMDAKGRTYQAFDNTLVGSSRLPYQRSTRCRTGDASTSTA